MIVFETARLKVRRFSQMDEEIFFALNGNDAVMRYIRPAKSRAECSVFLMENITYCEREKIYGRWAVEDKITSEFVGSFAIIPVPGKEEQIQLGYALLPAHWGKGYATELSRAGIDYVFDKTPVDLLYAYTRAENLSSQKVLVKAGFNYSAADSDETGELVGFTLNKAEYLKRNDRLIVTEKI
jgi:ribosomal-protein-alanine N-acetyltransferase